MKRLAPFILLAVFCLAAQPVCAATLSPEIQQQLLELPADETIPVILQFSGSTDLDRYSGGRAVASQLILDLKETAVRIQEPVLSFLRGRGLASDARSFWINNSLALRVNRFLLQELASFPEIETIDFDVPVRFDETAAGQNKDRTPVWNLNLVRVPAVWNGLGFDGTGIVVGSMDTGADIGHPALAGKWRGGNNSWIDIINGQPAPYDDHGHGTHTIGTMIGGDGSGPFDPDIGVAYNALFISAKVLDHNNSFSSASIVIAGAEWILDPDDNPLTDDFPHVVNNSWYFFSQTYTGFYYVAGVWQAAGIIPVFCLGNEGPNGGTTRPPGNYDNVLGIGATTSSDLIWTWSSRGPSPAGSQFPDDRRKPDLSAPGHLVRSSLPGGGYADWSGTSMATPHVAGTVALMLQAMPSLTYGEIRDILIATAVDLGTAGYDHDFGFGRLDAFDAVTEALGLSAVEDPTVSPARARLGPSFPNPFNPHTSIQFNLARSQPVKLEIFGLDGRLVDRLLDQEMPAGDHVIPWRGLDSAGRTVASGAYLYVLEGEGFREAKRMTLLK